MTGGFEYSAAVVQGSVEFFDPALLLLLIPAVFGDWSRLISGLKVEKEREEEVFLRRIVRRGDVAGRRPPLLCGC